MFVASISQLIWLNFAPITTPIMVDIFHTSEENLGWLSASWPLIFILLSIPAGIVADKKGYRFTVLIGSFIIAFFALLRLAADSNFMFLLLCQSLAGVGQPFVYVVISILVVQLFPENERALATGLAILAQLVGLASSLIFTPLLVPYTDFLAYRNMLLIYGLIALLSFVCFFLFGKGENNKEIVASHRALDAMKEFFRNSELGILLVLFFIGIGFFTGLLTWLESALVPRGISVIDSGLIASLILIGGILGSFVIPYASGKLRKRKVFFLSSFSISALMLLVITFSYDIYELALASFLLGFFLVPSLPIALDYSSEIVEKSITGTVQSILWLGGQAGAVVIIPVMGSLENMGMVSNPFMFSLLFIFFLDIIALILCLFIKTR